MISARIDGMDKVLGALNKKIKGMGTASKQGLIRGGFFISRKSSETIPVDLGNLRASQFVTWGEGLQTKGEFRNGISKRTGQAFTEAAEMRSHHVDVLSEAQSLCRKGIRVVVGYSANYAVIVHEDMEMQHKEGKRAKYLQKAITENMPRLLEIIAGSAKGGLKK